MPLDLHSFPTRRSSDLPCGGFCPILSIRSPSMSSYRCPSKAPNPASQSTSCRVKRFLGSASVRSEEHTSELQSRLDLVCRLQLDDHDRLRAAFYGHRIR